jgi:hypothetical protein
MQPHHNVIPVNSSPVGLTGAKSRVINLNFIWPWGTVVNCHPRSAAPDGHIRANMTIEQGSRQGISFKITTVPSAGIDALELHVHFAGGFAAIGGFNFISSITTPIVKSRFILSIILARCEDFARNTGEGSFTSPVI